MAPAVGKSHHGPQGRAKNRPCELAKDPGLGRALGQMEPTTWPCLWTERIVKKRGHALGGPGQNVPDDQMLPECLIPHSDIIHMFQALSPEEITGFSISVPLWSLLTYHKGQGIPSPWLLQRNKQRGTSLR